MYDELEKDLRICAEGEHCDKCGKWEVKQNGGRNACEYAICTEAADAIEELTAIREEQKAQIIVMAAEIEEQQPRWIPVTERLPKYGERVLVFGGVTMYVAYYDKNRYGGESWHKLNSKSHYCNPTHWMPLPRPPKEG